MVVRSTKKNNFLTLSPLGMMRFSKPREKMVLKTDRVLKTDLPADKSLTHRFIFLSAMAEGESVIVNPSTGHDCLSSKDAMEAFGIHFDSGTLGKDTVWRVRSLGVSNWKTSSEVEINAGNSGTTARLLIGLGAAIPGLKFQIFGDESLSSRPMERILKPLKEIGANVTAVKGNGCLPVKVEGQSLKAFQIKTDVKSAQVKSALLFAATQTEGHSTINAPIGSRDHTERLFSAMRAPLTCNHSPAEERTEYSFEGPWTVEPFRVTIPGDPSAMAFFAVLAFVHPGLKVQCKNILGNEGRNYFLKILQRSGLDVKYQRSEVQKCPGEETGDFEFIRREAASPLMISEKEAPLVIDEIPILAVAALACQGESIFSGLGELRFKESDRLGETVKLLSSTGVVCNVDQDSIRIECGPPNKFLEYSSLDHRMVMAASVLGTLCLEGALIGPVSAVNISFPDFFEQLGRFYN